MCVACPRASVGVIRELTRFRSFFFSPKNPLLGQLDMEDERELSAAMMEWCPDCNKRGFLRVAAAAGLTGSSATVKRIGRMAFRGDFVGVKGEIASISRAGEPVCRGGQLPGAVPCKDLWRCLQASPRPLRPEPLSYIIFY